MIFIFFEIYYYYYYYIINLIFRSFIHLFIATILSLFSIPHMMCTCKQVINEMQIGKHVLNPNHPLLLKRKESVANRYVTNVIDQSSSSSLYCCDLN